jgi:signal transduction histidine kinase
MPLSKVKIRWGYLIAFLLLLISYTLIFYTISKQVKESGWVTHSYTVINHLESIKAELIDAETGVRGYILTKEVRFLKPYNSGSKRVMPLYSELVKLTGDNVEYKNKLLMMEGLLVRRLETLSKAITDFQRDGFVLTAESMANRGSNKELTDSIRAIIATMQESEQKLVEERDKSLQEVFNSTRVITVTSLVIALITIIYSIVIYHRENKARVEADSKSLLYRRELEKRVDELAKVNTELQELRSIEKFASTGRIARTIAHEVRNPLTNITLAADQLKELITDNEEAEVLYGMIGRNANRINQLVSDLLNSTRFAQLEYTKADINQLLDETLEQAKDRIELNQVRVEKYYERSMQELYVDKDKMKLAFLNLIVNAIEATEKGKGTIQIRTQRQGEKYTIEIKDNGTGMDAETQQKLFEPYFTSKIKGNGLGLTNTQNIILNHKGSITVRSKKEAGSSFCITLSVNANNPDDVV